MADYSDYLGTTDTGGGGGSNLVPVPNSPGMYYDPATGQVYGNPGGSAAPVAGGYYSVPGGAYDPNANQLTLNGGQTYAPNPTYDPNANNGIISPSNSAWQPTPTDPTQPPVTGGGGGGGASTGGGGLPSPFTSPFTPPTPTAMPTVPNFTPPGYTAPPAFQYQAFTAPSMSDVLNDPGYQLPLQQGLGAISNDAAARGLWATGGTGKAFQDYAQNYAAAKYGDIYNRNLNTYETNFNNALNTYATNAQTQYLQPYQFAYQAAKDAYAPQLTGYETNAAATQRANEFNYNAAFEKWLQDFNQKYSTAGFLQGVAGS